MRNSKLVLLVDDDLGFQEIVATKLKRSGFLVAEAHDGKEAIEKCNILNPDLVLMDVNMPKENGTEAVMDLSKKKETPLKVVFLTSMNNPWPGLEEGDALKVSQGLGAAGFLNKSEDIDILIDKIKGYLA